MYILYRINLNKNGFTKILISARNNILLFALCRLDTETHIHFIILRSRPSALIETTVVINAIINSVVFAIITILCDYQKDPNSLLEVSQYQKDYHVAS